MAMLSRDELYGHNNIPRTTSLILELCRVGDKPFFTLSTVRTDYPSLQKLFIDLTVDDPTEATFAETVFGSIDFWLNLRSSPRLEPYVNDWCYIADIKRKQKAFEVIISEVENNNNYQAAKYLIEEPWKTVAKDGKEAKRKSRQTTREAHNNVKDDIKRLKEEGYVQ